MRLGRGRAADEERYPEVAPFHFGSHARHLVKRRRDQPRQSDEVGVHLDRCVENRLRWRHDAEVGHVEVVASQHDADDVLADIVHVALDGGHDDLALAARVPAVGRLRRVDERSEVSDGLFHHAGALDDLGQEHLSRSEQVADDVHTVHQRSLDDIDGTGGFPSSQFRVFDDMAGDPLHQGVGEPFGHGRVTPFLGFDVLAGPAREAFGDGYESLGGVVAAVQHRVLDGVSQVPWNLVIDSELAGIDDAHRQAGPDGVVDEDGVHCLAHGVVAAKGERDVADASGTVHARELPLDPSARLYEINGIVRVIFYARRNGEDVGVEDDVFGGKVDLVHEDVVRASQDLLAAIQGVCLAGFVERHDHDGCPVCPAKPGLLDK